MTKMTKIENCNITVLRDFLTIEAHERYGANDN
jgi:hypothetical protein